jgi:hypothetical protein
MLVVPDNSDDIVRELLRTCENESREGLALINSFDDELRYVRQFMFFRFMALRKLALRGIFANSLNTDDIVRLDIEQLRALVTAEELELSVEGFEKCEKSSADTQTGFKASGIQITVKTPSHREWSMTFAWFWSG